MQAYIQFHVTSSFLTNLYLFMILKNLPWSLIESLIL